MSPLQEQRQQAEATAQRLKVYAQPQRLMILSLLCKGEQIVGDLERLSGIGQPALSQQLAELRRARLVIMRRVAKQVFYDITSDDVRLQLRTIETLFGDREDGPLRAGLAASYSAARTPKAPPRRPSSAAAFARVDD